MRLPHSLWSRGPMASLLISTFYAAGLFASVPDGSVPGTVVFSTGDASTGIIYFANDNATQPVTQGCWPRVSPDGNHLVFRRGGPGDPAYSRVWVRNLQDGTETEVYANGSALVGIDWLRDSSGIVFDWSCGLYRRNRDGTGEIRIFETHCYDDAPAVHPDGTRIVFHNIQSGGLLTAGLDGGGRAAIPGTVFGNSDTRSDVWPAWSPDGSRIAFSNGGAVHRIQSDGSSRSNLVSGSGRVVTGPVANNGVVVPAWTPDGNWVVGAMTVDGEPGVFAVPADGSGQIRRIRGPVGNAIPTWVGGVSGNVAPVALQIAELGIAVETADQVAVGRATALTFRLSNDGNRTATNPVVRIPVPAGIDLASATSVSGTVQVAGAQVEWRPSNLPAGQSVSLGLSLVPTRAGTFDVVATTTPQVADASFNNAATARLAAAEGFAGSIELPGQTREYRFDVAVGTPHLYVFDSLTDRGEFVWQVVSPECRTPSERSFQYSDGDRIGDSDSVLDLDPGSHRLVVRANNGVTGDYAFNLLRLADAPLMTVGAPVAVELVPGNSTRTHQFAATAGDLLRVRLTPTNSPGLRYRLVDPFGRVLQGGYGAGEPVSVYATGQHFLIVEGNVSRGTTPGSYGIEVVREGSRPVVTASELLTLGSAFRITNSTPFTNSWRFTVATSTRLAFTPLAPESAVFWQLVGPAGATPSRRLSDDNWSVFEAPPGDYQFTTWRTTAGESVQSGVIRDLSQAPLAVLDSVLQATNSPTRDDRFLRIPLQAGQTVFLEAIQQQGFTYGASWALFDERGNLARNAACNDLNGGFNHLGLFTAPRTAEYVLGLGSYVYEDGAEGTRSFRVSRVTNRTENLALGSTYAGSIEAPGQTRTFTFSLETPRRVSLDVLSAENAAWTLNGPTGVLRSSGFASDQWWNFDLPSGDYSIVVSGRGSELPSYRFRLLDLSVATPLTVGSLSTNTLAPANGTIVLSLNLASGRRLFAEAEGQSGFPRYGAPYWTLIAPDGSAVFDTSFRDSGVFQTTQSGTHLLLIGGGVYEDSATSGQVVFRIQEVADTTASLALDTPVAGNIGTAGAVNRYTFSLAGPQRISIDALDSTPARFELTGPFGSVLQGTFASDSWWIEDLVPGDYTLAVSGSGSATPAYRFQVATAEAGPLFTVGTTNQLAFATGHATRFARFQLVAGQRLTANVVERSGWTANRPQWRLLGPNGTTLFDEGAGVSAPFVPPVSGTYTLAVGGALWETADPASLTFVVRESTSTTAPLTLGTIVNGQVAVPGQEFVYTFDVPSAGNYHFDGLVSSSVSWRLDGPQGRIGGAAFNNDQPWVWRLVPGRHVVTVSASGATTGAFGFRILALESAPPLSLGVENSLAMLPANGSHAFSIPLAAGQTLTNRLLSRTNLSTTPTWAWFDPAGRRILWESIGVGGARTLTTSLAGNHQLVLLGALGESSTNASLRFVVDDGGVVAPPAFAGTALTFGSVVEGDLADGATNAFTFRLTEPTFLGLDVLAETTVRWSLRNRDSSQVNNDTLASADWDARTFRYFLADPGDYQLVLRGPGSYRFRIQRATDAPTLALDTDVRITNTPASASVLRRFQGVAGQSIRFLGSPAEGWTSRPLFTLWRPSGTYFQTAYTDTTPSDYTLPETGEYVMLLGGQPSEAGESRTIGFRLHTLRETTSELVLGTPIQAQIPGPNGVAQYTFRLDQPRRLMLDARTNVNLYWTLSRPDQVLRNREWFPYADIDQNPANGQVPMALPAGDYTLAFDAGGSVEAPGFEFALLDVDLAATPITVGQLVTGTNAPANSSRLYRFEATAGETFVFEGRALEGFQSTMTVDWFQAGRGGADLGNANRTGQRFTVTRSGTQLLHLSSSTWQDAAAGPHQFVLWNVSDTSRPLVLGATTASGIATPTARTVHVFEVPSPTLILVDSLEVPASQSVYHTLTDDRRTLYSDRLLPSVEWYYPEQLLAVDAGTHRLSFRMDGQNTNRFAFRVLDAGAAPSFVPGSTTEVRFPTAQGTEIRRFSGNAGDRFYYRAVSSSGFEERPYLRIFGPDGTRLWEAYADRDRDVFTLPATGTFHVVVNSFAPREGTTPVLRFQLVPVPPATPEPLFETFTSPDLVVSSLQVLPGTTTSGGSVEVRWSVRNTGDAAATNAFSDRVVIRNASGAALVSRGVGDARTPLAPGAQFERSATLRLPDGAAATGALEVTVTADAANSVAEANAAGTGESNNGRTAGLTSTFAAYADLVPGPATASPDSGWLPGQTVTLRWAVTNSGALAANGPWSAQVVVSNTQRRINLLTTQLAFPASPLGAGTVSNRVLNLTLPDNANVYGTLEVRIVEDAANEVAEFNLADDAEENNAVRLTVESAPDLAVAGVFAPATAQPGVPFEVVTVLTNRGTVALSGTWQNALLVSADATLGDDTLALTESLTAILPAGGSLRRTNSVVIPELGEAGTLRLVARADIGNAIPESDEGNNAAIAEATTTVPLRLAIRLASPTTREDGGVPVLGTVSRNGSRTEALSVALSGSDASELQVPPSVVIPAGQASATFEVLARPDDEYDGPVTVSIQASAPGFEADSTTVTVLDDDVARLTLAVSSPRAVEGQVLTGTVRRAPSGVEPLTVQLTSADLSQLGSPVTVVIPGGQAERTFSITAVEDTLIERTNTYTLTASAAGFAPASVSVAVEDNDLPAVVLALASRTVSEGAGANATTATLTRSPVTARAVTVALVSGDTAAARVPANVVIPANAASVSFPVAAVDNAVVDGSRVATLGGSVLDSVTGSAVGEVAPDVLTVTDNDGPTLSLFLTDEVVPEGRNPATRGTLLRNTSTDAPLVVQLASSDTAEARVPASVTVPAGTNRVEFDVESVADGVTDGNRSVTLTANAAGFTPGSTVLVVSDADLPDLVVSRIQIPAESVTGGQVTVAFRVENRGVVASTNSIVQRAYLSTDNLLGNDTLAAQITFDGPIPAGGFIDQTLNLRLPDSAGSYYVILQTDATSRVAELLENNNTRVSDTPTVSGPSYTARVSTSVGTVLPGTVIPLTGTATRVADGTPARSVPVVVHLRVRGFTRTIRTATDADGRFAGEFLPLPSEAGHYEIAAEFPGLPMPTAQDDFTILGLDATPFGWLTVVEGSNVTASSVLRNLSDQPLTGLAVTVVTNHPSLRVTPALGTNRLAGDAQAALSVRIDAVDTSAARSTAMLRVTSTEGVSLDLPILVQQERLTPRLVVSPGRLEQPMVRGRSATVTFSLRNDGGADTGNLDVLIPSIPWLSLATPNRIASLPPGSNTVVTLRLNPPADLPLGDYPGSVALNSALASTAVPFEFRCTSDGRGELQLVAEDEYTYFAAGSPRLTNALVVLREALGGNAVATNRTDTDGQVLFTNLVEAYYLVDVTAEGHNAYRQSALVPAGGRTNLVAFLPRETVRYNFTVTPTTVEDRYSIEIQSTFETQVPVPVVTISPASLDIAQFPGEEFQVEFTIENHGLINAENVQFNFPQGSAFTVTPLITEIGTLAARTSIRVPAIIRRIPGGAGAGAGDSKARDAGPAKDFRDGRCSVTAAMLWDYLCGPNVVNRSTAAYVFDSTGCDLVDLYFQVYELVPTGGGSMTTAEFVDYLDQFQPVIGFEAPPGYEFRCRETRPSSLPGGKSDVGISSKSRRTGLPFWEAPKAGNETCARVRLQIDQRAVLTRDAFNARLEIQNDTDDPIENLFVTLDVRNVNGEVVTTRFGIRDAELNGLTGVNGTGLLGARATGAASWILVPTLDAAPTNGEAFYLVGGTMTYRQGGLDLAVPLAPAPIRVFPQPELLIRYFHDRDVFSDDPFTDEIEPSVPYSLVAQVNNVGYGDARNLVIEGGEPRIVDNEKGLLIDFTTLGTQVEDRQLAPSLRADFGQIPAGSNRVGRWVFTSSLQGSFTNFNASFRHLDALGVERLSLLRSVEIHELSHIVQDDRLNPDGRIDLLVNDVPDPALTPDTLYLSDGRVLPVLPAAGASVGPAPTPGNLRVDVSATMPAGWGYLRIPDPGAPEHRLTRVLREDSSEVSLGTNAWTTDRFIFGGDIRPVRTNLVHILDHASTGRYTLVYEPVTPPPADLVPPVSAIEPLPARSPATFAVRWNSTDEGLGTAFYDVYVSEDGAAFRPWLERTPNTGGLFVGSNGRSYGFYVRATDQAGNIEARTPTAMQSTQVALTNNPPILSTGGDVAIDEGTTFTATIGVTDPDAGQSVTLELLPGAPAGLLFDPASGSILWQTSDGGGPSVREVHVRATDNGTPAASVTATLRITVREANQPPTVAPVEDMLITERFPLAIQVQADDDDRPSQALSYTLVQGPSGARLDPATGLFEWRPRGDQGPSTNEVRIRVTDSGSPAASTEVRFNVFVRDTTADLLVAVGSTNVLNGAGASLALGLNADPAITNVSFRLPLPPGALTGVSLAGLAPDILSATLSDLTADGVTVRLELLPGTSLTTDRHVADLHFTTRPGDVSDRFLVDPFDIAGLRANAQPVDSTASRPGTLILIGLEPVLDMAGPDALDLYARPGTRYRIEAAPDMNGPWTPLGPVQVPVDGRWIRSQLDILDPALLFRAIGTP